MARELSPTLRSTTLIWSILFSFCVDIFRCRGGDDDAFEEAANKEEKLYRVSDASGKLEITPVKVEGSLYAIAVTVPIGNLICLQITDCITRR